MARFTGGLLLLLAILHPPAGFEQSEFDWEFRDYREALAQSEAELNAVRENALAEGIAAGWSAYIEDKAGRLGAEVSVSVTLEPEGAVPEYVTLRGAYHEKLSDALSEELGIAKEKQIWIDSG